MKNGAGNPYFCRARAAPAFAGQLMKPPPAGSVIAAMPSATPPTMRSLARSLGLSRTTVSDALRGNSRVNLQTVQRVRAAAMAAGYERNALAGAVMSMLRKSRGGRPDGVLAVIEAVGTERSRARVCYNDALFQGIRDRAGDFGFTAERFEVGPGKLRLARLEVILHTRGIQGLLLLPSDFTPDYAALQWHRYAAMYLDDLMDGPCLHAFCPDHYRSMANLLRELWARGFRRPGLLMETPTTDRLQYRWAGAFLAQQYHRGMSNPIPPLQLARTDRPAFEKWFELYRPDVVLGPFPEAVAWITACGGHLPSTHGFVCLNHLFAPGGCAALDLQVGQIGSRATEFVIAQLTHRQFGVPTHAALTSLPACLVEGDTLRQPSEKPLRLAAD